jgi:hypothetical protein
MCRCATDWSGEWHVTFRKLSTRKQVVLYICIDAFINSIRHGLTQKQVQRFIHYSLSIIIERGRFALAAHTERAAIELRDIDRRGISSAAPRVRGRAFRLVKGVDRILFRVSRCCRVCRGLRTCTTDRGTPRRTPRGLRRRRRCTWSAPWSRRRSRRRRNRPGGGGARTRPPTV